MKQRTAIYSIFGQCEQAAAEHMIGNGKATRINADMIPAEAAVNVNGERALFAVVVPGAHVAEFNELCDKLRA